MAIGHPKRVVNKLPVERMLLGKTLQALRARGIYAWPQVGMSDNTKGAPNVGAVLVGRAIYLLVLEQGAEPETPKPTMSQASWLDMAVQHGAFCALVTNETELRTAIDRLADLGPRARTVWEWRGNPARIPRSGGER